MKELSKDYEKYYDIVANNKKPDDAIRLADVCERMGDYSQAAFWYMHAMQLGFPKNVQCRAYLARFMLRWHLSPMYPSYSEVEAEIIPAVGFTMTALLRDFHADKLDGGILHLFALYCYAGMGIDENDEMGELNDMLAIGQDYDFDTDEYDVPEENDENAEPEDIPDIDQEERELLLIGLTFMLYDTVSRNTSPLCAYCRKLLKPICRKYAKK